MNRRAMQAWVTFYYTYARSAAGGSQTVPNARTFAVQKTIARAEFRALRAEIERFANTLST